MKGTATEYNGDIPTTDSLRGFGEVSFFNNTGAALAAGINVAWVAGTAPLARNMKSYLGGTDRTSSYLGALPSAVPDQTMGLVRVLGHQASVPCATGVVAGDILVPDTAATNRLIKKTAAYAAESVTVAIALTAEAGNLVTVWFIDSKALASRV